MVKKDFCTKPFEEVEIQFGGNVHVCCPNWNNYYSLGSLYEESFENIWNSEKAIELRKRIMNNDYSLCDTKRCPYLNGEEFNSKYDLDYQCKMPESPKVVRLSYDYECNIICRICRNHIRRLSDEELEVLNSKIDSFFIPILKDADILFINGGGDPFGARHSRLLIKKAVEQLPNLKFDFHTNGLLFNEWNFKDLNLTPERIETIRISIHAATKETYGRIVEGGEELFPKIIENIKFLNELRKIKRFDICVNFVICSKNYTEIPKFIELAEGLDVSPYFWEFRLENCTYENPEHFSVFREDDPDYPKLLEILKHPKIKEYKLHFSPVFQALIEK